MLGVLSPKFQVKSVNTLVLEHVPATSCPPQLLEASNSAGLFTNTGDGEMDMDAVGAAAVIAEVGVTTSDTSVELGGILLGKECLDPTTGLPFVWISPAW